MATSRPSLSLWSPSYSSLISPALIHSVCLVATHSSVSRPLHQHFPCLEALSLKSHTAHPSLPSSLVLNIPFSVRPFLVTLFEIIFSPTPCASFLLDFARNHLPSNTYTFYLFDFFPLSLTTMECKLLGDRNFGLFCLWLYYRCLAQNLHIIETWSTFF